MRGSRKGTSALQLRAGSADNPHGGVYDVTILPYCIYGGVHATTANKVFEEIVTPYNNVHNKLQQS